MCIHNGTVELVIDNENRINEIKSKIIPYEFPNITIENKNVRVSKTFGFVSNFPECVNCKTQMKEIWVILEHGRRNMSAIAGNGKELTLDHIVPRAKNGLNSYINFQTMCHDCNNVKGHEYNGETKPVLSFNQAKKMLNDFNIKDPTRRLKKIADSKQIYYDKLFSFEEIKKLFKLKLKRQVLINRYDHYLIPSDKNLLTFNIEL